MKHLLIFALILSCLLSTCKDQDAADTYYDARQIEGDWIGAEHPHWRHWFSNGRSKQQIIDFGQIIYELEYHYRTSADTVFQRDLTGSLNFERVWTVEFPDYNTCYVVEWTPSGDTSFVFTLLRQ